MKYIILSIQKSQLIKIKNIYLKGNCFKMLNKSNIKAIFFDLYGTLLICENFSAAWADWFATFYDCLKKYGLSLTKHEFKVECDNFFGKQNPIIQKENFTVFEKRILSLCNDIGLALNDNQIQETALACVNNWQDHMKLDAEAIAVLKILKEKFSLALISNFDHPPHVHSLLTDLQIRNLFDSIIISGDVGVEKPDPIIFLFALKETGISPNNCVYVGDENIDSIAAKAAGIHSITIERARIEPNHFNSFYKSNLNVQNQSSIIISKLSTLIEMLM